MQTIFHSMNNGSTLNAGGAFIFGGVMIIYGFELFQIDEGESIVIRQEPTFGDNRPTDIVLSRKQIKFFVQTLTDYAKLLDIKE